MAANSHQETGNPEPHLTLLRLRLRHVPELRAYPSCFPQGSETGERDTAGERRGFTKFSPRDDIASVQFDSLLHVEREGDPLEPKKIKPLAASEHAVWQVLD